MKTHVSFFLISCLSLNVVLSYPWSTSVKIQSNPKISNCSANEDNKRAILQKITIDPPQPKKGSKFAIKCEIDLKEEVTSGEVKVSLKYGKIPIVDETLDLCDLVTQINKQCPLEKGKVHINIPQEAIPDYVPSGNYDAEAKLTDQNGSQLICLEMILKL